MKNFMLVFKEFNATSERTKILTEKLYSTYRGAVAEEDVGIFLITTTDSAEEVVEKLLPEKGDLSDVFLVIEIGATAAVGCAGTHFINALSKMAETSR